MAPVQLADRDAPRGRPRQFDEAAVLDRAMQLFWERGFEAASLADIVEATGLNKSSLYNTFGSKDELFRRALEQYLGMRSVMLGEILDGTEGTADLLKLVGYMELEATGDHGRLGCLAVNSSTELGCRDDVIVAKSAEFRELMRSTVGATLQRAAAAGEIDPAQIATYTEVLMLFMMGMSVSIRGGASDDEVRTQFEAARRLIAGWRLPTA